MTKSATAVTLADLRTIDLFDGCTDEEIQPWLDACEPMDAEPGEVLSRQGNVPPGLFLLFEGVLDIVVEVDGRFERTARQVAPTWTGAVSCITDDPMPVSVVATDDCRFALIARERFVDLVFEAREVHRRIMRVVAPVMSRLSSQEANRERLASLGTMAAGLAHELNNPAAAAKRAASELVEALRIINYALEAFVNAGIEREDAAKLIELQHEASERAAAQEELDAVAASDAEDAMLELLEDMDIPEAWRVAEPLSFLDQDWLDRVHAIAGPVTYKTLRWVAASVTAKDLADELNESTGRMSTLVAAVKTYAYMDRGGLVTADIHEGLESTLVILSHKLKHTKIKVVRDYDKSLPKLTVHGSELNQVWTNIIHNAIQALGESGTITLKTSRDGPCIRVDVGDDGPGIPDDAKGKVFDPFFTTKPVGSGTGLGLDTCRRIVEDRHNGSIDFDTGPEGTVFHVWLPIEDTAR
jgi:signal transduction histidine kinase